MMLLLCCWYAFCKDVIKVFTGEVRQIIITGRSSLSKPQKTNIKLMLYSMHAMKVHNMSCMLAGLVGVTDSCAKGAKL